MSHGYESGRLNLPFVGISTFGKSPYQPDWSAIDADVAVMGAPFDMGTQWRAGARFGPRSVREASTLFSFGHAGAYDHEDDVTYLEGVRMVDIGDADIVHTDTVTSHANIEAGVRAILAAGALPVVIGGDHSVNIPCIRAFDGHGPIHIVQIDAHLDFVDVRHGVRFGHGNPMRRAAEQAHVTGLSSSASATCPPPRRKATRPPARWAPTSARSGRSASSGSRRCWPASPRARATT
jgi:agmatinase